MATGQFFSFCLNFSTFVVCFYHFYYFLFLYTFNFISVLALVILELSVSWLFCMCVSMHLSPGSCVPFQSLWAGSQVALHELVGFILIIAVVQWKWVGLTHHTHHWPAATSFRTVCRALQRHINSCFRSATGKYWRQAHEFSPYHSRENRTSCWHTLLCHSSAGPVGEAPCCIPHQKRCHPGYPHTQLLFCADPLHTAQNTDKERGFLWALCIDGHWPPKPNILYIVQVILCKSYWPQTFQLWCKLILPRSPRGKMSHHLCLGNNNICCFLYIVYIYTEPRSILLKPYFPNAIKWIHFKMWLKYTNTSGETVHSETTLYQSLIKICIIIFMAGQDK